MEKTNGFLNFADNLFEPVLVFSPHTQSLKYANPAATELFGFQDNLDNYNLLDVIADASLRLTDIETTIADEKRWSGADILLLIKDGATVAANINATPIEFDKKPMIALMIQNRNTGELAELGQDVRKIAHDIRGALSSTQLICDRISEHEDLKVRRASELLARSLNRVFQMCLEIVNVGKAKNQEPRSVQFYLSDLISDLNASLVGAEQNSVIALAANEEILVEADYDQIYRALLNLSRNARNAGATQITISGQSGDGGAQITISDDGPGIPEDTIPNLFKQKTRYRGSGTGLGLIITHEIITSHKGSIELVKNDEEGAMFSIYLPHEDSAEGQQVA